MLIRCCPVVALSHFLEQQAPPDCLAVKEGGFANTSQKRLNKRAAALIRHK